VRIVDKGHVSGALKTSDQVGPASPVVILKPYEAALAEARRSLVNAEAYELGDWSWGYKEPAGGVSEAEIRMVYEFAFVPRKGARRKHRRPQVIEVPARADQA
jgi:hypothetical protein